MSAAFEQEFVGSDSVWNGKGGYEFSGAQDRRFSVQQFVEDFKRGANQATNTSNKVVDMFASMTRNVLKKFFEFACQAVEIAISKFLVELCAMVIAAVSSAVLKKYNRNVDITTGGVYYSSGGNSSSSQSSSQRQDPLWGPPTGSYDSGWSSSSRGGAW